MRSIDRRIRLLHWAILFFIGGAYALWLFHTGRGIPCLFHRITGLQCPGCGVSRLCLALLRGDLAGAWRANAYLLCILPLLAVLLVRRERRLFKNGACEESAAEKRICLFLLAGALFWGAARNIALFL